MLVCHGADLEARDGEGLRPIHVAAKTGRHVALLALLAAGADAWSVTPRKWNAFHYSIAGGYVKTTRLLAYWDADSGVLGRQKNSAGVAAMDLGRCDGGPAEQSSRDAWKDQAAILPLIVHGLFVEGRKLKFSRMLCLPFYHQDTAVASST